MPAEYDRNWVHPLCTVRPIPELKLVQDYVPEMRALWEHLRAIGYDPHDPQLRRIMVSNGIKLDKLHVATDDLCEKQDEDDACWKAEKSGYTRNRRWMADEMGLFPAFNDKRTLEYDFQLNVAYDGKLWTACRWGTKQCCRPSHLVVGQFAGKTPGQRLVSADKKSAE